ncbi:MAG: hypothetical protein JNG86_09890 [Verrucomicrobiaceae bacterium]|nr:hypothetical protein [Verrucomicrobiaceae bacterium]
MDPSNDEKSALRLDLAGYRHSKWTVRMKARLLSGLHAVFGRLKKQTINPATGETVEDETAKLTSKSLRYAEARLDAPSIENQLKTEQIEKTFDEREKLRAETRRTDAEAKKILAEASCKQIENVNALLELHERLIAFQKRTGKKIDPKFLGGLDDEVMVFPGEMVAFLEEVSSDATAPTNEHDQT